MLNDNVNAILEELSKSMEEFEKLEKLKVAHEQNKIALTSKQLQELENKYKILYDKINMLKLRAKKL